MYECFVNYGAVSFQKPQAAVWRCSDVNEENALVCLVQHAQFVASFTTPPHEIHAWGYDLSLFKHLYVEKQLLSILQQLYEGLDPAGVKIAHDVWKRIPNCGFCSTLCLSCRLLCCCWYVNKADKVADPTDDLTSICVNPCISMVLHLFSSLLIKCVTRFHWLSTQKSVFENVGGK